MEYTWLIEEEAISAKKSMVLFFKGSSRSVSVIDREPQAFCAELAERWSERHSAKVARPIDYAPRSPGADGLVFISYAREDEAAARQVKADLEAHGCAVHFDRERLSTGQSWDVQLEDRILRCAVFVSVISRYTEASVGESHFHRERNWAEERARSFSRPSDFYVPILVDEMLPASPEREPRIVSQVQWYHCPGGHLPPELAQRVGRLQQAYRARH